MPWIWIRLWQGKLGGTHCVTYHLTLHKICPCSRLLTLRKMCREGTSSAASSFVRTSFRSYCLTSDRLCHRKYIIESKQKWKHERIIQALCRQGAIHGRLSVTAKNIYSLYIWVSLPTRDTRKYAVAVSGAGAVESCNVLIDGVT